MTPDFFQLLKISCTAELHQSSGGNQPRSLDSVYTYLVTGSRGSCTPKFARASPLSRVRNLPNQPQIHRRTVSHSEFFDGSDIRTSDHEIDDVLLLGTRGVQEAEIQDREETNAGVANRMDELKARTGRSNGFLGSRHRDITRVTVYFWKILSLPPPPHPFLEPRIFVSIDIERVMCS